MADHLQRLTGILLVISAVTHVAQLGIYGPRLSVIGAVIFGLIYLVIGVAILRKSRTALKAGIVLPAIGGALGIVRYLFMHSNPFTLFHLVLDVVVILGCFTLLRTRTGAP